jgi:S-adenosylmethionine hydrolase
MTRPLISLLTDFGLTDPSVSACKGVIWRILPDARLLDVSHGVTRHAVAEGAALLWAALPYLPAGVHMAVVDPGVGTERRPIALRTGRGDHLVGPDNGLLVPAADRLGGIVAAHVLEREAYRLAPVSRTFHARDIFAPAAAHIAGGVPIAAFGPAVDPASLVRLDLPIAVHVPGCLEASVVLVDSFGNAQLLAERCDLEAAIGPVSSGDRLTIEPVDGGHLGDADAIDLCWRLAYGDAEAGEPLVSLDSYGRLAVSVNLGSAAATYELTSDRRVRIRRS